SALSLLYSWSFSVTDLSGQKGVALVRIRHSGLSLIIATGLAIMAFGTQVGATELSLKAPPPPTFSCVIFGPSGVEIITAQRYRKTDGTAGGPIIVLNTHVLDI